MMMQTPEDDMFKSLLSNYSASVDDNGFSNTVFDMIAEQERLQDIAQNKRKAIVVGIAGIIGGAYAALQIPGLLRLVRNITLPKVDLAIPSFSSASNIALPAIETGMFGSNYMMVAAGLMAIMVVWLAGSLTLGDNM